MNTQIKKTVLAGIIGTVIMTAVMMIAQMMGMPKMSPPKMLAGAMGLPIAVGFIMHFMVGIGFAFFYTFLVAPILKICNLYLKGAVFGVIAFVMAQTMMIVMGTILPMEGPTGPLFMVMIAGLMGHVIFGVVVAKTVGNAFSGADSCERKVV